MRDDDCCEYIPARLGHEPQPPLVKKLYSTELCATCGMSLKMPADWPSQYYFTIDNGKGVHHDWCWSTHPSAKLRQIEEVAKAAWDAGL
jgi:hypothetical protein